MKTPVNCCFVVRIICAHDHDKRMASPPERLRTTGKNVFTKNKECSLIRVCSLTRSNTICVVLTCMRFQEINNYIYIIQFTIVHHQLCKVKDLAELLSAAK